MHYLWRAVDQEGEVLESFVTTTRDKAAALTFMRKTLKQHGSSTIITTDGLRSYKAATNELGNAERQEIGRWANNRVENAHLPFRRRKRAISRFTQLKTLQSSPLSMLTSTTTSASNATSLIGPPTRNDAPPP